MATVLATPDDAPNRFPFLLSPASPASFDSDFMSALKVAVVKERAADGRRTDRCRIAGLLCELALELGRIRKSYDGDCELPLSRADFADMLGISLVRTKRAFGLLLLTRVLEVREESVRVLDWPRLCAVARFEPARLGCAPDDENLVAELVDDETPQKLVTAAGDPACFV